MEIDRSKISSQSAVQLDIIAGLKAEFQSTGLDTTFGLFMTQHALNVLENDRKVARFMDLGSIVEETSRAIKLVKQFENELINQNSKHLGAMD